MFSLYVFVGAKNRLVIKADREGTSERILKVALRLFDVCILVKGLYLHVCGVGGFVHMNKAIGKGTLFL